MTASEIPPSVHSKEIWKSIPNFDDIYCVSNKGRVLSYRRKKPKILKPWLDGNGYWQVCLGAHYKNKIHRLVAITFHGEPPVGYECSHLDGNSKNNNVDNLRWVPRKENHAHKKAHGTHLCGEKVGNAKLNAEQVSKMRVLREQGWTFLKLSRQYKVSRGCVRDIIKRRNWRHI